MITANTYFTHPAKNKVSVPEPDHRTLLQVLVAAVINPSFQDRLLHEPLTAIEEGFNGQKFWLSAEELDILIAIQADSIETFAAQLETLQKMTSVKRLNGRQNGHHKMGITVSEPVVALTGSN